MQQELWLGELPKVSVEGAEGECSSEWAEFPSTMMKAAQVEPDVNG